MNLTKPLGPDPREGEQVAPPKNCIFGRSECVNDAAHSGSSGARAARGQRAP